MWQNACSTSSDSWLFFVIWSCELWYSELLNCCRTIPSCVCVCVSGYVPTMLFSQVILTIIHFLIVTWRVSMRKKKQTYPLNKHTECIHLTPPPVKDVKVLVGCQQFPFLQAKHQGLTHKNTNVKRQRRPTSIWINLCITAAYRPFIHVGRIYTHIHTLCASNQGKKKIIIPNSLSPSWAVRGRKKREGENKGKTFVFLVPEKKTKKTSKW